MQGFQEMLLGVTVHIPVNCNYLGAFIHNISVFAMTPCIIGSIMITV